MRFIDIPKEIFKVPWLESGLASMTDRRSPGDWITRLPPLYKSYKKGSIRHAVRNHIRYELDISDYMEWLVYFGIQAEPRESLYQLVEKGNTVLDIGTNIGEVALNLAKLVGSSGVVHTFEPDPFVFSKLSKNYSLNTFTNIYLNNFALGDAEGELTISAEVNNNRGGTRVSSSSNEGNTVRVTTVDHYADCLGINKIDVIKIDVEGYELKVLQGAMNSLRKFRPALFIEINEANLNAQGDSASALIAFLNSLAYNKISEALGRKEVSFLDDFSNCHFDIIAT